jgi:hypothetical protein
MSPTIRVAAVALTACMLPMLASTAEAGSPYTCICDGQKKRFIAGTHSCEVIRDHGKNIGLYKHRPCSDREYRSWHRDACAESKCTPYRY